MLQRIILRFSEDANPTKPNVFGTPHSAKARVLRRQSLYPLSYEGRDPRLDRLRRRAVAGSTASPETVRGRACYAFDVRSGKGWIRWNEDFGSGGPSDEEMRFAHALVEAIRLHGSDGQRVPGSALPETVLGGSGRS